MWFAMPVWDDMAGGETDCRWRGKTGNGQNNHNEGEGLMEDRPATFAEIGRFGNKMRLLLTKVEFAET